MSNTILVKFQDQTILILIKDIPFLEKCVRKLGQKRGIFWRNSYSRTRDEANSAKVDFVELFFDLVFVFAITQISHLLLHDLSIKGLAESALMLAAIWWVWVYTMWCNNWLDPATLPGRIMLFVLMLAGLVLSTSIPTAFGERGTVFACAFVFMQVGRSIFMIWNIGDERKRIIRFSRNDMLIKAFCSCSATGAAPGAALHQVKMEMIAVEPVVARAENSCEIIARV
ncbi:hypothetical protein CU102_07295 [Phyllobacterium brassicacearum]|uniref:Low temperature requirement protein A n=2 Tax=Phyllobacterium brassicacearum TaxID=314235 RepID=A0A2P7BT55_9HYPH|nr:hypothetical protein CU102_07295 [Phyllobacterium brassicacearum]